MSAQEEENTQLIESTNSEPGYITDFDDEFNSEMFVECEDINKDENQVFDYNDYTVFNKYSKFLYASEQCYINS